MATQQDQQNLQTRSYRAGYKKGERKADRKRDGKIRIVSEWTGLGLGEALRKDEDRKE